MSTRTQEGMKNWFLNAVQIEGPLHLKSRWSYLSEDEWNNMVSEICKRHKFLNNEHVLEVGCGVGAFLNKLPDYLNIEGIDIIEEAIEIARKVIPKGNFYVASALKLPSKSDSFEHVLCNCVLPYLSSLEEVEIAIFEMLRVLKPGGKLTASLIADNEEDQRSFCILIPKIFIQKILESKCIDIQFDIPGFFHQGARYSFSATKML